MTDQPTPGTRAYFDWLKAEMKRYWLNDAAYSKRVQAIHAEHVKANAKKNAKTMTSDEIASSNIRDYCELMLVLALILWVGASVSTLGTTVTRISTNVDQVQKSISDLQTGQTVATKSMADLQAAGAKTDARADALEADMSRTKERVRILEGNPPLNLSRVQ